MNDIDQPARTTGDDPADCVGGTNAPTTATVLRAASAATTAYNASTAQGAATALIHVLMEQLFGYSTAPADPPAGAGTHRTQAAAPQISGVAHTGRREPTAVNGEYPALPSVLLVDEIIRRTAGTGALAAPSGHVRPRIPTRS